MGLRHELKRAGKKTKKAIGGITSKKGIRDTFRSVFGDHTGKKVWNYVSNPARALQRSHSFGHSLAPSWSDKNVVTKAFNKAMSSLSKSAERAADRYAASVSGNSASSTDMVADTSYLNHAGMPSNVQRRLDYSYRRLSDLT